MSDHDLILQIINAIYASSTDMDRLPKALEDTSRLLGASGAIFEVAEKATKRSNGIWCGTGTPNAARKSYIEKFEPINPRFSFAMRLSPGQVICDRHIMDEAAIARDPFYAEFLPRFGLRYFVAAVVQQTAEKFVAISVQRTQNQGHVEQREIDLLTHLCPHYQRAYDMALRLIEVDRRPGELENTLDWLTDGVALLRADASIIYANEALWTFARHCDAFRIIDKSMEFLSPDAHNRFVTAFDAVRRARYDVAFNIRSADFPAPRKSEGPAYTVAVRPISRGQAQALRNADAVVMVLVRDPLARNVTARNLLTEMFGLTEAEGHLAQALCAGMTTGVYATTRRVTLNTVYTHLRHIRGKTQCNSVAELVRKFGEINVPLRLN